MSWVQTEGLRHGSPCALAIRSQHVWPITGVLVGWQPMWGFHPPSFYIAFQYDPLINIHSKRRGRGRSPRHARAEGYFQTGVGWSGLVIDLLPALKYRQARAELQCTYLRGLRRASRQHLRPSGVETGRDKNTRPSEAGI